MRKWCICSSHQWQVEIVAGAISGPELLSSRGSHSLFSTLFGGACSQSLDKPRTGAHAIPIDK